MTLEQARTIRPGDYLCTPHSAESFEPLRVTDVHESPSGRYVHVRIHKLAGVSQMAGGWCDARAFIFAPQGFKWDRKLCQYTRTNADGVVLSRVARSELVARWRAESHVEALSE